VGTFQDRLDVDEDRWREEQSELIPAWNQVNTRYPSMQLAIPPPELRWDHGDGLVLRGLTQLPVTLRP
jgi:hypothetical protein